MMAALAAAGLTAETEHTRGKDWIYLPKRDK